MYFKDLSTYQYEDAPELRVQRVGWLGTRRLFDCGETPATFKIALRDLCENHAIWQCAGHHACELCSNASWHDPYYFLMGNGEIWVRAEGGTWYAAPRLITHYVEAHRYLPPAVFVDAVMNPREIGLGPAMVFRCDETEIPTLEVGPFVPKPFALDRPALRPLEIPRKKAWWRRVLTRSE